MMYEFKVSEMAEEFGVHRNTIRNWINSGNLPAKEGPGRKYLIKFADYQAFCKKFGREPHIRPTSNVDAEIVEEFEQGTDQQQPRDISYIDKTIYSDPQWADICLTCGTCASACPIAGVTIPIRITASIKSFLLIISSPFIEISKLPFS